MRIAQLYPACFALDSFRRKTWSGDPGNKMAFLPRRPQPRHKERGELQRTYMRASRQEGHLGIEPPSRRATRHHQFELEKATATRLVSKSVLSLQTAARRGISNDSLQCCALYCEPASLSAAPTDSRRMFAWIFIKYITLGWTNSPVYLQSLYCSFDQKNIIFQTKPI
jgi:hypothetical protein